MQTNFKRGDTVTVRLTAEHELEGDLQAHSAKFIRTLPGQDWAEVQLEEEHAGGTKTLHVPLDAIEAAQ
jgi:hypothetical protein